MGTDLTLTRHYARTLSEFSTAATDVWVFEPFAARVVEQRRRAEQGQSVRIHSAYKTLLHTVLEQHLLAGVSVATICYPVVEGDEPKRFRLECYPLQSMFSQCELTFEPVLLSADFNGQPLPSYRIEIPGQAPMSIPVPVRWVEKPTGRELVACGWINSDQGGEWLTTEFEHIYADAYDTMLTMPLTPLCDTAPKGPFFNRLTLSVGLPAAVDTRLPIADEQISLAEALHEDLYFSALEIFQYRLELSKGSRELEPGQVLPMIRQSESPTLTITTAAPLQCFEDAEFAGMPQLDDAGHWLTPRQIEAHLSQIGGQPFVVSSRQDRPVWGRFVAGRSAAQLAISSGQHANESSGIVGGLRAAHELASKGEMNFTICPLNNPDGYAAFRELCQTSPCHMHHAARYTASGNDLAFGTEYESTIYEVARSYLPAAVHLNLHGYPAHEWTRPLSGYVPSGFPDYTLPKGFFLICRYQTEYRELAEVLRQVALQAIADHPEQMRQNRAMLTAYRNNVGEPDFELAHEFVPYVVSERDEMVYPIEFITEAPDETVYGESFRIAHETHYRLVMAVAGYLLKNT